MYDTVQTSTTKAAKGKKRRLDLADVLGGLAALMIVLSLYAIFVYAPPEREMGDIQRIFYYHMPSALTAFLSFAVVFVSSIGYLAGRNRYWDMVGASAAEIGVLFTTVALITGSIWAKPIWNTWWTWDPRLTTTLVLWLIYVAYLMLRLMIEDNDQRARISAVFGIVGFVDVPIVFMSIRWWRTIHPVVLNGAALEMDITMVYTLLISSVAFVLLFAYLLTRRVALEKTNHLLQELRGKLEL